MNTFNRLVLEHTTRFAMPIMAYPGKSILAGVTVRDIVTKPQAQLDAAMALYQRYKTPFVLSAMDLSVEASAFGANTAITDNEVPSVHGRLITSLEQARALQVPKPGAGRTWVYMQTINMFDRMVGHMAAVYAGCIGPFSLAARLAGTSEALELTLTEPDLMHALLEKSTTFLSDYIRVLKFNGAQGIIMAEPTAGLLSPKGLTEFSSAYVKQIIATVETDGFSVILHNCAAKLCHLPAILESGASAFHFGVPMDIVKALEQVPKDVVLCGNLDPTSAFCQSSPIQMAELTQKLYNSTFAFQNFVMSSGCDLPAHTPLANLDAFFKTIEENEL